MAQLYSVPTATPDQIGAFPALSTPLFRNTLCDAHQLSCLYRTDLQNF